MKLILAETSIPRIRFASVEPWDLPEGFFGLFENQRLMPHMHLPLQSGSDAVLRKMARRCKTEEFHSLVEEARQAIPGFNVTTDIIVGFPGETEDDWQRTLEYVESIGFGHMHIFSYSQREGTKAAGLPGQIPNEIRKQRSREMHELGDRLKTAFLETQVGHDTEVLWEQLIDADAGKAMDQGFSRNYLRVQVEQMDKDRDNLISPVRITGVKNGVLTGEEIAGKNGGS